MSLSSGQLGPAGSVAAQALLVRRAVQPLLLHGIADSDAWTRAAAVSPDAWRLFLRVERCALPLARALERHRALLPGDAVFQPILSQVARHEFLHVMVARSHFRKVAALAETRGTPVIVLKGGVLAFSDPIAMADADVLIPAHEIDAFSAQLRPSEWDWSESYESSRVASSLVADGVPLELHRGLGLNGELDLGVWERSEPLGPLPPLRQLGCVDQVRHVAQHVSLDHSYRRVRIRDLYLLARAAQRCREEQLATLWTDPAADYPARAQRATLDAVLSRVHDARLEREAIVNYLIACRTPWRHIPRDVHEMINAWAVTMRHSAWERQKLWETYRMVSRVGSSRRFLRSIERHVPQVGRAVRQSVRLAGISVMRCVSWTIAVRADRHARQALTALGS